MSELPPMLYKEALEALEDMIKEARSVPLSASAVIPRAEALKLLDEIKDSLPRETEQAREILGERERILGEANERARYIVKEARDERARILAQSEMVQAAERESTQMVDEAQMKADQLASQADDYADAELAKLEIILGKMLRTLGKGREQLRLRLDAAHPEVEPLDLEDSGEISGPITSIDPGV